MLIMKSKNNEVTARLPTMADVLLGNNPIPLTPIPVIRDPNDFAEKTKITGLINQRVKNLSERERATITVKAMILGWFHHSLEDYMQSAADPSRAKVCTDNDWPKIMGQIKNWYLEQITQSMSVSGPSISIAEKDNIMREYREMYMTPFQSVNLKQNSNV